MCQNITKGTGSEELPKLTDFVLNILLFRFYGNGILMENDKLYHKEPH